ncbi:MAG: ATP-binding protein [Candidatus Vogelbacteria bacterium]|nr:ATP-binding protein [Candidatus Vogelbacteria bacterium]
MKKIVLTGGPCAGKTEVLTALAWQFAGQIAIVPEAATVLLSGGFPAPGSELPWSEEWQAEFQRAICQLQPALEEAAELKARSQGARILLCDRGLLDGAAYTPGGRSAFCSRFGLEINTAMSRYSRILHLESLATANPEQYGRAGNAHRLENLEQAQALELATREVWSGHPGYFFLRGSARVEAKTERAGAILARVLRDLPVPV